MCARLWGDGGQQVVVRRPLCCQVKPSGICWGSVHGKYIVIIASGAVGSHEFQFWRVAKKRRDITDGNKVPRQT